MAIIRRLWLVLCVLVYVVGVVAAAILVGAEIGPLPLMLGMVFCLWMWWRREAVSDILGSARIADFIDLVFSGLLFEKKGVLLGQTIHLRSPRLRTRIKAILTLPLSMSRQANAIYDGPARQRNWLRLPRHIGYHMAYIAPTGGGKSAGNVISNLLTDPSTAIVMDYKGELLATTAYARMRKFGHKVICIAPFGLPSGIHFPISRFNPFQLIDPSSRFFHDDAGSIANSLVIHNPNDQQPFFNQSAEALIHAIATALIVEATAEECTLGTLRAIISQPDRLDQMLDVMMSSISDQRRLLRQLAGQIMAFQGKTRSDVLSTANTHLRWLDSPAMAESLAITDKSFQPRDLLGGKVTIYIHIPVHRLLTYRRYIRTLFSSLTNYIFHAGESKTRRIRFYLDESYGLGQKLDALYAAMVYGRSFGINLNFYFQALSQIEQVFESSQSRDFLSNVHPVFTNIQDIETARLVSAWIGRQTVEVGSKNHGWNTGWSESTQDRGGHGWSYTSNYSGGRSRQQQVREVLQPEEILQLPRNTTIITLPHIPPILAQPVYYFQDRRLKRLAAKSLKYVRKRR